MQKTFTQCQSCGMPRKYDQKGWGTEADGSLSAMYCSSCYRDGAFVQPEMTVQDMQQLVDDVLKNDMGWWWPLRWLAVRQISMLKRWSANR